MVMCVRPGRPFFGRLEDARVKEDFDKAVDDFATKIKGRAVEKRKEQQEEAQRQKEAADAGGEGDEEYVELSKEERLGPGGLDPVEVFEELPKELQECFEKEDIPMLKEVLAKMNPDDAAYHMKRCIDSGLWVENAKA